MDTSDEKIEGHEHHRTSEVLSHLRLAISNLEMLQKIIDEKAPCLEVVNRMSQTLSSLAECRSIAVKDHVLSCIRGTLGPDQQSLVNEVSALMQHLTKTSFSGSHH